MKSCFLWVRKCFLDVESFGEEAVMIVEILTKSLEYYKTLMIKQWQCLRGLTLIFERSSVGKMLPVSIACYKKIIHEREDQCEVFVGSVFVKTRLHLCLILRSCHSQPQPLAATNMISQQPLTLKQDPQPAKWLTCWRLSWWLAIFRNKVCSIKVCTFFRHNAIVHLISRSINITYMHWKTEKLVWLTL